MEPTSNLFHATVFTLPSRPHRFIHSFIRSPTVNLVCPPPPRFLFFQAILLNARPLVRPFFDPSVRPFYHASPIAINKPNYLSPSGERRNYRDWIVIPSPVSILLRFQTPNVKLPTNSGVTGPPMRARNLLRARAVWLAACAHACARGGLLRLDDDAQRNIIANTIISISILTDERRTCSASGRCSSRWRS